MIWSGLVWFCFGFQFSFPSSSLRSSRDRLSRIFRSSTGVYLYLSLFKWIQICRLLTMPRRVLHGINAPYLKDVTLSSIQSSNCIAKTKEREMIKTQSAQKQNLSEQQTRPDKTKQKQKQDEDKNKPEPQDASLFLSHP